jgi:AraC-like DNA-binding protein
VEREAAFAEAELGPRLFFDDPVLRQTAIKLETLVEAGPLGSRLYAEALGSVLVHELLRLNRGKVRAEPPTRGGLAGWQRRLVAQYIEEKLSEQILLAELAELAQLSVFHFSRAFKQSFGMPPHRYHTSRRIECTKILLAKPNQSVTEIALDMGFGECTELYVGVDHPTEWIASAAVALALVALFCPAACTGSPATLALQPDFEANTLESIDSVSIRDSLPEMSTGRLR